MANFWYPFYAGDYARDTALLSLIEHGAYRLLLDHYYSTGGPLPADKDPLYRLCRAFEADERAAIDKVLNQFFSLKNDGYHNGRADRQLFDMAQKRAKLSESGRRGAARRWSPPAETDGQANGHPNGISMADPESESKSQSKPESKPKSIPKSLFSPPSRDTKTDPSEVT